MRALNSLSFKSIMEERIVEVKFGCDLMPKCGSYGAQTLITKSGRELVIWSSMGEVCLSEVLDDETKKGKERLTRLYNTGSTELEPTPHELNTPPTSGFHKLEPAAQEAARSRSKAFYPFI